MRMFVEFFSKLISSLFHSDVEKVELNGMGNFECVHVNVFVFCVANWQLS